MITSLINFGNKIWFRVLFDVVLFLLIFWGPFWLFGTLAILGVILFENYFEIIFASVIYDITYGLTQNGIHFLILAPHFIMSVVLYFSFKILRTKFRF